MRTSADKPTSKTTTETVRTECPTGRRLADGRTERQLKNARCVDGDVEICLSVDWMYPSTQLRRGHLGHRAATTRRQRTSLAWRLENSDSSTTLVLTDRVQNVHADCRRITGDIVDVDADQLCDRSRLGGRDDDVDEDDVGSTYVGCETTEGSGRPNSAPTGTTSRHIAGIAVIFLSSVPEEVLVQSRPW